MGLLVETNRATKVKELINLNRDNVENSIVRDSHRIDAELVQDAAYGLRVVATRAEDPMVANALRSRNATINEKGIIATYLEDVHESLIDHKDPTKSTLVSGVNKFLQQSNILLVNDTVAARQAFLDEARTITGIVNRGSEKAIEAAVNVDSDIRGTLDNIGSVLKKLHENNLSMLVNPGYTFRNQDIRDSLLNELSGLMDISVNYGPQGIAFISTKKGSYSLLDGNGPARLEVQYSDETNDNPLFVSDIKGINLYQAKLSPVCLEDYKDNVASGGKIAGLIKARDEEIPNTYRALQKFAKELSARVNLIYNDGTTWPPKEKLVSTNKVSLYDAPEGLGAFTVFAIDKNGNQIDNINPSTIDINQIPASYLDKGRANWRDIINEFNNRMNISPGSRRAALGQITGQDVGGDQYLLNNIQITGRSNISQANEWNFDLSLTGNKFFGSNIEVLGVTGPGGDVPQESLPGVFRLERDENLRTNTAIKIGGMAPGGPPQDITLKIRVTGDNGAVQDGTVTFSVDPSQDNLVNRTVPYVNGAVHGFIALRPEHAGIATMKMIDDNGIEIDVNSPKSNGLTGTIVVEANPAADAYFSIKGGNLSHLLGLNNFFSHVDGMLSVNINDPSDLSVGKVAKSDGVETKVNIGDKTAEANLVFNGALFDGDEITIDGQTLTFRQFPAAQNDVLLDGVNDLQSLVDAINAHPQLKSKVSAILNGNRVMISAKSAGVWGNNITVGTNLAGGANATLNGGAALAINNGFLIDGSNREMTILTYDYSIGKDSRESIQEIVNLNNTLMEFKGEGITTDIKTTLVGFASNITSDLSRQYNNIKQTKKIQAATFDKLNHEYIGTISVNRMDEIFSFKSLSQHLESLLRLNKADLDLVTNVLKTLQ